MPPRRMAHGGREGERESPYHTLFMVACRGGEGENMGLAEMALFSARSQTGQQQQQADP